MPTSQIHRPIWNLLDPSGITRNHPGQTRSHRDESGQIWTDPVNRDLPTPTRSDRVQPPGIAETQHFLRSDARFSSAPLKEKTRLTTQTSTRADAATHPNPIEQTRTNPNAVWPETQPTAANAPSTPENSPTPNSPTARSARRPPPPGPESPQTDPRPAPAAHPRSRRPAPSPAPRWNRGPQR